MPVPDSPVVVPQRDRLLLREWCVTAGVEARHIQSACAFEGWQAVPGADQLGSSLESLLKRTARPDVRILILGPLKSGKSTLINVLLNNPRLSQITQYPAYPCFIEVRDLPREGAALSPAHAVFVRADGQREAPVTLEECRQKLDELLNRYISGESAGRIDYQRVEQRVDLQQAGGTLNLRDLDLVVVDSPGLFFQRSIDANIFGITNAAGQGASEGDYSSVTQRLYKESDVAIFVIRWEQLFFHQVGEYLSRFREDIAAHRNLRTFVIVNCSARSWVQDEDRFETIDQTALEHRARLTEYFERHVADDRLIAQLRRREHISLHFCDLIEVAQKTFGGAPAAPDAPQSDSDRVIEELRQYIFHRDLPRLKLAELKALLADVRGQARALVRFAIAGAKTSFERLHLELAASAVQIDIVETRVAGLSVQQVEIATRIGETQVRQNAVNARSFNLSDGGPIGYYARRREQILTSRYDLLEPATRARVNCSKIYLAWRRGSYGARTLKNLADRVWNQAFVVTAVPSLADLHADARQTMTREQVRLFRGGITSEAAETLLQVARRLDERDVVHSREVPASVTAPPLLNFHKRLPSRLLMRLPPAAFWGDDGGRVLSSTRDLSILEEKEKDFDAQIWGDPWQLGQCFDASLLKDTTWQAVEERICTLWLDALREEAKRLSDELTVVNVTLAGARAEREHLSARTLQQQSAIDDVAVKRADLERRLNELQ